jgi:hypothetical protein
MIEFECCDCHQTVLDIILKKPPDPPRCCVCAWIVEWVPEHEQAAVRERLQAQLDTDKDT